MTTSFWRWTRAPYQWPGFRALATPIEVLWHKRLAKTPEERIASIRFPQTEAGTFINWEKVSKRRVLDIATVNSAAKIRVANGRIVSATLALRRSRNSLVLSDASEKLVGLPWISIQSGQLPIRPKMSSNQSATLEETLPTSVCLLASFFGLTSRK